MRGRARRTRWPENVQALAADPAKKPVWWLTIPRSRRAIGVAGQRRRQPAGTLEMAVLRGSHVKRGRASRRSPTGPTPRVKPKHARTHICSAEASEGRPVPPTLRHGKGELVHAVAAARVDDGLPSALGDGRPDGGVVAGDTQSRKKKRRRKTMAESEDELRALPPFALVPWDAVRGARCGGGEHRGHGHAAADKFYRLGDLLPAAPYCTAFGPLLGPASSRPRSRRGSRSWRRNGAANDASNPQRGVAADVLQGHTANGAGAHARLGQDRARPRSGGDNVCRGDRSATT